MKRTVRPRPSSGIIFDLQKYAVFDGPGIRTTVFFKGCPLRCQWCQNPESLDPRPERAPDFYPRPPLPFLAGTDRHTIGYRITTPALMNEIVKDRVFFQRSGGGVTCSGGEPLQQPEFLLSVLWACRRRSIHTCVETSGYAPWPVMNTVARLADLVLFDLKVMEPAIHRRLTGVDNGPILDNLRRLADARRAFRVRVPVIPGVNDQRSNAAALGRFLRGLPGLRGVDLLPFNGLCREKYRRLKRRFAFARLLSPSDKALQRFRQGLSSYGIEASIGG